MKFLHDDKYYARHYCGYESDVFAGFMWKHKALQAFGDDFHKIEAYLSDLCEVEFSDGDINGVAVGRWVEV